MPIDPALRAFYRSPAFLEARALVIARATGPDGIERCEWCKVPNRSTVLRAFEYWTPATVEALVFFQGGRINGQPVTRLPWTCAGAFQLAHFPAHSGMKWAAIRLGTAHLDHNPANNAVENLARLCGRCHLVYDGPNHRQNKRLRRDAETGQLRLELGV